MRDLYFDESGDLAMSSWGDLALTESSWREAGQEAFIRIRTEETDFLIYPTLGTTLTKLYGLPNNPQTARLGVDLISDALTKDGRFFSGHFTVRAIPVGPNEIRFDVAIVAGGREQAKFSVSQQL